MCPTRLLALATPLLTGKQLNKAVHCEEESGHEHEPTISKGKINCHRWALFYESTVLLSYYGDFIIKFMTDTRLVSERPKETAKSTSNVSGFPVLITVRFIVLSCPHVQGVN